MNNLRDLKKIISFPEYCFTVSMLMYISLNPTLRDIVAFLVVDTPIRSTAC